VLKNIRLTHLDKELKTDVSSAPLDRGFIGHFEVIASKADAASNTGVHAAVTDTGGAQTVKTSITSPDVPRNITATAGRDRRRY
jgi:hypothetical protein